MMTGSSKKLIQSAEKAYRAGRHAEAVAFYQQAEDIFSSAGDLLQAAEMANNRSVVLLEAGQPQAALEACSNTIETFALAGEKTKQALALGNQAAALEALNQLDEALACYQESSDLLKQVGDQEYRAYVLKCISALQLRTGRHLEGLAAMEAALENKKKLSFQEQILKKIIQIPFQMVNKK